MTPTPEAAERSGTAKKLLGLLGLIIAGYVIYISFAGVIGAFGEPFPPTWPFLVGLATPVVLWLLVDWLGLLWTLLGVIGVQLVVNDNFQEQTHLGSYVTIVTVVTAFALGFVLYLIFVNDTDAETEDEPDDEGGMPVDLDRPEPDRIIVGLSGYAGAGKDTAAEYLIDNHGFTRVSFADKLREVLLAVDPLIPVIVPGLHDTPSETVYLRMSEYLEVCDGDWTEAKKNFEVRALLQRIGTDAGRKVIGENVWVDAVMNNLPEGDLIFTDMRFPNEYESIVGADGGVVVRINRPGTNPVNAHPSEVALDGHLFHATITNAGEPWELGEVLAKFVGAYTGKESMLV